MNDPIYAALRGQIEQALAEYQQFRDTPYESMHTPQVRQALDGVQRELRRIKSLHQSWCSETQRSPSPTPDPIHSAIRQALRGMTAKQRDAIIAEGQTDTLNAVIGAPCYLSGITQPQQAQVRKAMTANLYGDAW